MTYIKALLLKGYIAVFPAIFVLALARAATPIEAASSCFSPHVHLTRLNGDHITFDEYHGNVVIMAFWTTWCYACRTTELPGLARLRQRLNHPGLEILLISNDAGKKTLRDYLDHSSVDLGMLEYAIFFDPDYETYHAILGPNSIQIHPNAAIIDRSGCVVSRIAGPHDWLSETTLDLLNHLLNPR